MTIAAFDRVTKIYANGTLGLDEVSFSLESGLFGLLGENGAGKSTTLGILTLGLQPTAGSVVVGGLDASNSSNHRTIRRQIGFLPQRFEPIPQLTAREYLTYCARLKGMSGSARSVRTRVGEVLEELDLSASADRRCATFSGGMKRRLGVCQAVLHDPRLVVLDEPATGLDPGQRRVLREFLDRMARRSVVVLSTHLVADIESSCSQVGVLSGGRLLFNGHPESLLGRGAALQRQMDPDGSAVSADLGLEDAYLQLLASARERSPEGSS